MTTKASETGTGGSATATATRIARLSPQQQQLLLDRMRQKAQAAPAQPVFPAVMPDPENLFQPFPLTEPQEALWLGRSGFFELGECGTNLLMELEFSDVPEDFTRRLEAALNDLVQRHPMLRAIILPGGTQKILPKVPVYQIKVEDFTALDGVEAESRLEQRREQMRSYLGALDRWPLFEVEAFRPRPGVVRVMARFEGIMMDGSGRLLLLRELIELITRPETRFPQNEFTYRDYALAARGLTGHPLYESSREYWSNRLETLPPPPGLECRRTPPGSPAPRCVSRIIKLMELREWKLLKARAAALGITATGLAARVFADALAAETGSDRFTLGMIGSLHLPFHPDVHSVIGNFNTVSLLEVDGSHGSFGARAQRMQDRLTRDLDNRYYSGFQVLRELRRRNPGPQVLLPAYFNSVLEYSNQAHKYWEVAGNNSLLPYRMVELNLVLPQIVVMFTVADTDGFLACKCQTLDEITPTGFAGKIIAKCKEVLTRIFEDRNSFSIDWTRQKVTESTGKFTQPAQSHFGKARQVEQTITLPGLPLQCYIVALWKEILDRPIIGIKDSFFDLGGTSLALVSMLTRLEQFLEHRLTIEQFWANPTIEGLCASISDEDTSA
jgi:acyl carrier protein